MPSGKVRISEMATMWNYQGGGPGGFANLVNLDASLRLLIKAFVDIGVKIPFVGRVMKRVIDVTLVNAELFHEKYRAPNVQPALGRLAADGTLYLNTGPDAGLRRYLDTQDGNEHVRLHGDGTKLYVVYHDWVQSFTGVRRVVGRCGDDTGVGH